MSSKWAYPEGGVIPLPYHHTMLADANRCQAFERAIERAVRPGDVVLEAGAGTGILSYFASRKARKVYAVEADPEVASMAHSLLALNGLEDKVHYQLGRAENLLPEEPVDVVICEMMHAALAVEQQVPVMNAVHRGLRQRFPGHPYRVVPEGAVNYCQLVQASFDFWGFRAPFTRFGSAYIADPSIVPLSPLVAYSKVDFDAEAPERVDAHRELVADASGEANALRVLTQAVLSFDQTLPADQKLIDWYLQFLIVPLPEPQQVQAGERFAVEARYDYGCSLGEMRIDVRRSS